MKQLSDKTINYLKSVYNRGQDVDGVDYVAGKAIIAELILRELDLL
jgi:hypothetical protein